MAPADLQGGIGHVKRRSTRTAELQRARILSATMSVVEVDGYAGLSVARVVSAAGVSRKTFYEQFANRENCFLALLDECVDRTSGIARRAYESEPEWRRGVRAALAALLRFLEREPGTGMVMLVHALAAGPRVVQRHAELLQQVRQVLDRGGDNARGQEPSRLAGEVLAGGLVAVVRERLLAGEQRDLYKLTSPLTSLVVLPYMGASAATHELHRRVAKPPRHTHAPIPLRRYRELLEQLGIQRAYRVQQVLEMIAASPGLSNREIATGVGGLDAGQVSRILSRLERLGLIANHNQEAGSANDWRLSRSGRELQRANSDPKRW